MIATRNEFPVACGFTRDRYHGVWQFTWQARSNDFQWRTGKSYTEKTFKYLLTINDTDDDKKIIIYFFKSNETEVEHSKSYKSQVRATWSVNCFTERRDLVRGYRETSNFLTTTGYTVRGGVGSMLSESLSLSKCVIFRYPISDLSEPLLKREEP